MEHYEKPEVLVVDDLAEGVYASSGSSGNSCDSIYMNGVYVTGTFKSIQDGYKAGYGCNGCPVAWGRCAVAEVSWEGDFRPSWEKAGKLPDEKGY